MFDSCGSIDALPVRNVLKQVTLRDYQAVAAVKVALHSSHILIFDTGRGKTYTTLAGLQMKFNLGSIRRVLWLCPLATSSKTLQGFRENTSMRGDMIQGTELSVDKAYRRDLTAVEVLVVNYEAFDNQELLWLFKQYSLANIFDCVVLDESHLIADPFKSNRNAFIWLMAYRIQNIIQLTATPVISSIDQYASLLALATKNLTDLFSIRHFVHRGDYGIGTHPELLSFSTRKQKVKCTVVGFDTSKEVDSAPGVTIFKQTRGPSATEANNELLRIITEKGADRFLVHCLLTSHHKFLKHLLESTFGIRVGIVSGGKSNDRVLKDFQEGSLDAVIFSITTGIDMDARYMVLYDWTVYAAQAIGRGLRQEEVGEYEVYFLLSSNDKEQSLFTNSVIKHSELTFKAIGKVPINLF